MEDVFGDLCVEMYVRDREDNCLCCVHPLV